MRQGKRVTIQKMNPHGELVTTYDGEIIEESDERIVVAARWTMGNHDFGFLVLEQNDLFIEYYYPGEWYNIFEISRDNGLFKGWYCNITRPVEVANGAIIWRDLALDIFVNAEGKITVLDEDEFEALGLAQNDPEAWHKAREALEFLLSLARTKRLSSFLHQQRK